MARRLDPSIKLQETLRNQLLGALQGEVLTEVRRATQGEEIEFQQRATIATDSLKITEQTMPKLYALCEEVKRDLEYTEDIDFYIESSPKANASAYISEDEDKPHIIAITSALFNLMDDMELKNIIGHEIGHLVNKDSYIGRLYDFIYPDDDAAPEIIASRMKQYDLIAEYAADRYGYNACMDLEASISALYKLTSGLDLKKMGVSIESLIDQNFAKVDEIFNLGVLNSSDHPDIPLRVHALIAYARCKTIKALEEEMDMLFSRIPGMYHSELDENMALFCAAAGILLATEDGKMEKSEKDMIIEEIAKYTLEPSKVLKTVQKDDVQRVFEQSVSYILDVDRDKAVDMLKFYIELSFADKVLAIDELESIKAFGKHLGLEEAQTYAFIANVIREHYWSLADSL